MAEYIERGAAINLIRTEGVYGEGYSDEERENDVISMLESLPATNVVEVVHGRWESYPSHAYRRCTACKVEFDKPRFNIRANYCPNCGAKMRGDKDG